MDFVAAAICLVGCFVVVLDLIGAGSSQNPVVPVLFDHAWLLDVLVAQLKHCDAVPHIPAFCSIPTDSFWLVFSCRSLSYRQSFDFVSWNLVGGGDILLAHSKYSFLPLRHAPAPPAEFAQDFSLGEIYWT